MRYLATVSYLGTNYHGFEKQPGLLTIQGELERSISSFLGEDTIIKAAGRTDAGVHARAQKITFDSARILDENKSILAINKALNKDIRIHKLEEVADDFDVRRDAISKIYSYSFRVGISRPLELPLVAQIECKEFNMDSFVECIKKFEGKHCFKAFTSKEEDGQEYVRAITDIKIEQNEYAKITFSGTGFMRYQIRFMVGTAFKVAQKKLTLEAVDDMLRTGERMKTQYCAPPNGLILEDVLYE